MPRRVLVLTIAWMLIFAALPSAPARAQEDSADQEDVAEVAYYGDSELIEALRAYDLLDEWIAASPLSPQASLVQVRGNNYQAQRQTFLDSLAAWARRTELVRIELARIDHAQANADQLRSVIVQVRDALIFDDRLAADSKTLVEIEDALAQLGSIELPPPAEDHLEDPLTLAEAQLKALLEPIEIELKALNGMAPALSSSGIAAFVGFDGFQTSLNVADELISRGRALVKPAREESERLVSIALGQLPSLHAARVLGSSDVRGLTVVTVDAYVRAAERSTCSVDWALLAGIGQVETNHGRIDGRSVARSGQVSSAILGPLLDGGATERASEQGSELDEEQRATVAETVEAVRLAQQAAFENSLWGLLRGFADGATWDLDSGLGLWGNGFAVIVDTDNGQLDGNDQWDRAVGPMQFLPETWSRWATDGNGDGVSDPHNLYDAAAAAARFLCSLSETRGSSPSAFLLGYNPSTSYVRQVLSAAASFRSTSLPDV